MRCHSRSSRTRCDGTPCYSHHDHRSHCVLAGDTRLPRVSVALPMLSAHKPHWCHRRGRARRSSRLETNLHCHNMEPHATCQSAIHRCHCIGKTFWRELRAHPCHCADWIGTVYPLQNSSTYCCNTYRVDQSLTNLQEFLPIVRELRANICSLSVMPVPSASEHYHVRLRNSCLFRIEVCLRFPQNLFCGVISVRKSFLRRHGT